MLLLFAFTFLLNCFFLAKVDEAQRKIRNVATADDPKCNSKALKSLIVKVIFYNN